MRIAKGTERRAEGQNTGRRSRSGSRLSALGTPLPPGFTLIELMVTMMIIGILAAAVLGVAAVATETAREAKTRGIISRIHTLLMEQYGTYVNRRVKLRPKVIEAVNNTGGTVAQRGQLKAEARLFALREIMLMEIPDRWSDVVLNDVTTLTVPSRYPIYLDVTNTTTGRTELASLYLRTFRRIASSQNKFHPGANTLDDILANQGAECLYMVVMNACGDGESRTLIPESSIGDVDGDGAPEFIDGWGHPIEFLRWAPGFESDIQANANELDNPPSPTASTDAWANAAATDHDPTDLYRTDENAFRLVPLIVSGGRDEEIGLLAKPDFASWTGVSDPSNPINLGSPPKLQPWTKIDGAYLGTDDGTKTATDDITNHLISSKPGG
jgi:prepilin-type N-terminal cleavage/methylation domain-containing protein